MDQYATWYTEVGLGPGDIVRWAELSFSPKRGTAAPPPLFGHVYCGQTTGWMKMPLGVEVAFGPGDSVLDRDPAALKGAQPPNFRPMSIVAKRLDGSRCHLVRR